MTTKDIVNKLNEMIVTLNDTARQRSAKETVNEVAAQIRQKMIADLFGPDGD